jgi:glycine/D-amino acid oxidase-like deaminating enzyme
VLPDSPPSLWLDRFGPYDSSPPLEGPVAVDVAVVGGGFGGLSAAREIKRADPALRVAVLEARTVGYGASGRNGSFAMTAVGLGFAPMAKLRGRQFVRDAHRYMTRAVDHLDRLIRDEALDCDRTRPGFLRVATNSGQLRRIRRDLELMHELGFDDVRWIDAGEVQARVHSPRYLGAMWEPRLVLIDPAKLVRAEKSLAQRLGVDVYEHTPVIDVTRGPALALGTPRGTVTARKIVFATNAYSGLLPGLARKQKPAFTYMIATAPLTPEQCRAVGWAGGEGIEDARNLIHYYRITPDRRLVMGGGPVGMSYGGNLDRDRNETAWRHLEEEVRFLFPQLGPVAITHRWGGPFSVTTDLTPALGYLGDRRIVYSLGCIGHGVSMSHLNGVVIAALVLERQSELLDCPFVNRRVMSWPPEPVATAAALALRVYLQLEDWLLERRRAA